MTSYDFKTSQQIQGPFDDKNTVALTFFCWMSKDVLQIASSSMSDSCNMTFYFCSRVAEFLLRWKLFAEFFYGCMARIRMKLLSLFSCLCPTVYFLWMKSDKSFNFKEFIFKLNIFQESKHVFRMCIYIFHLRIIYKLLTQIIMRTGIYERPFRNTYCRWRSQVKIIIEWSCWMLKWKLTFSINVQWNRYRILIESIFNCLCFYSIFKKIYISGTEVLLYIFNSRGFTLQFSLSVEC